MTHESETPITVHQRLLAFYGEDGLDIRIVHLGEKSKGQW
jgi:hypothetical protein